MRVVIYLPDELVMVTKCAQRRHKIGTFSGMVKSLLETHPSIVMEAELLYAATQQDKGPAKAEVTMR